MGNGIESIDNLIKLHVHEIFVTTGKSSIYVGGSIPEKKLSSAIKSYAACVDPSHALALHDRSLLGTGKEGCLLTGAALYLKTGSDEQKVIPYRGLTVARLETFTQGEKKLRQLTASYGEQRTEVFKEGGIFKLDELLNFFLAVIAANEAGFTHEMDGIVIVEDMEDEVKLAYASLLVWMTYQDDQVIDGKELMEIQMLMTQLKFVASLRHQVRDVILDAPELEIDKIIENMMDLAPNGSELALKASLMKDAVRIFRSANKGKAARSDAVIMQIAKALEFKDDVIEFLEGACEQEEKIFSGEMKDSEIAKHAKELAAQASAVGVPVTAIYLSGYAGLSAAGITSGLATLGLGGILGLSSMVSGVGVAIILGIGVYKGVRWLSGGSVKGKSSRREMMLQEVLRLHGQAIANHAEDISYFAMKIIELCRCNNENELRISKLGRQIEVFTASLGTLRSREERIDKEMFEGSGEG